MRKSLLVLVPACLFLLPDASPAQDPTLVVENARVIVGEGTVLEDASVVIAGDRIVETSRERVEASGVRRIDATGNTVLPGLIDTHVHLLMEKLFEQPRSDSAIERFVRDELPARLRAYLEAGVTTVMSAGDYWPFIGDVQERIESGELSGPRLYIAGPLFTAPGGHPAATFCGYLDVGGPNPWCREHLTVEVAAATEARAAVERLDRRGVDLIKLVYEGSEATAALKSELVAAIIGAAHRADLPTYGHITDPARAVEAIGMGLDGLVHVPVAAPGDSVELEVLLDAMRSRGVAASTTLVIFESVREIAATQGDEAVAREMARQLGGMRRTLSRLTEGDGASERVALGTDAPHLPPGEAYHREIALLSGLGLTPAQILRAATADAAEHLGVGGDLGTLEAGKTADLIVVEGNPLEDLGALRSVAMVVKGGRVAVGDGGQDSPVDETVVVDLLSEWSTRLHGRLSGHGDCPRTGKSETFSLSVRSEGGIDEYSDHPDSR